MKALYRMRFIPLLIVPLLVVMMVLPATLMASGAGGDPVPLGTTAEFWQFWLARQLPMSQRPQSMEM